MRIGILTFHWATNYGAVLQCFALQEYLSSFGSTVEIINYKPRRYDLGLNDILRALKRPNTMHNLVQRIKTERALRTFRSKNFNLTKRRFFSVNELESLCDYYDVLISGSDQVLNPAFVLDGEGKPTGAYFLTFASNHIRKVGYAVSFGTSSFPNDASIFASKWINEFNYLSVREQSGVSIAKALGFHRCCSIVPDPTLLLGRSLVDSLCVTSGKFKSPYYFSFMLHGARPAWTNQSVRSMSDTGDYSMEGWISAIASSSGVITNSYHAMIMSILLHRCFVVIVDGGQMFGMNDRFYTLLDRINLRGQLVHNSEEDIFQGLHAVIDWAVVDDAIEIYRKEGVDYLNHSLYENPLV